MHAGLACNLQMQRNAELLDSYMHVPGFKNECMLAFEIAGLFDLYMQALN
jgi:hypothetical protein